MQGLLARQTESVGDQRLPGVVLGFAVLLVYVAGASGQPQAPHKIVLPVLTKVAQVRGLAPERARLGYPVRLRAVVTYYHFDQGDLFIQDETAGIWVDPGVAGRPLRAGQLVEVEGVSGPGDLSSEVSKARLRIAGEAPLPAAQPVSGEELVSGEQDSQRVEVEGVVRSVSERQGRLALQVASGAVQFPVFVLDHSGIPTDLVDAKVRIRGVSGGIYNPKNQLIGVEVLVPALNDVVVEQAAPRDLFSLPVRPIHTLLRVSAQGAFTHRVRVQGVVTLHRPGRLLFIRDDQDGLLVQTGQASPVAVGDRVDVVGFPALGEYTPVMQDAIFRRIGSGPARAPSRVTVDKALRGAYEAELVRIAGRLVERESHRAQQSLVLQAGGINFKAEIPDAATRQALSSLRIGSLLDVTGICSVQVNEKREPVSFEILLRAPQDVVVLARPPWWTVGHALSILAFVAVVTLAALAWAMTLHRRVREQTEIIRTTLESTADGILVVDSRGRIVTFNQKFAAMWHIPASVLASRDDSQALGFALPQLKDPDAFLRKVRELIPTPRRRLTTCWSSKTGGCSNAIPSLSMSVARLSEGYGASAT